MSKIIGNTTATPVSSPDWEQNDDRKLSNIKNKPPIYKGVYPCFSKMELASYLAFPAL